MKKILSIGSGISTPQENVTRLDISEEAAPDVVWDLNNGPYPFESSSFDIIECYDVIEHVENIPFVMGECFRLLKCKGIFEITTPHFSSANSFIDPTHRYHLSYYSMDCFSDEHEYSYYSKSRYRILERKIMFDGNIIRKWFCTKLFNRFPKFYETRLAWIFPAWFIYFKLEAVK